MALIDRSPVPARMELRAATVEAHERLHRLPAFASLAAGVLDRRGYVRLLARLHGFHGPIEAVIARGFEADPIGRSLREWRRAPLLRSDLIHLGLDEAQIGRLPRAAFPMDRVSPAAAMGFLYVVEESALGGRQLARALDCLLPSGTVDGRSFLLAGTDRNHVGWRDVCAAVETCGIDKHARVEIAAAAVDAFGRFERWFEADADPVPE